MANIQITQLPAAQTLTGQESVPIVQNGVTVQTTTGAIANAPVQTQTFLTVNQEPTLPNSRYFIGGLGIGVTDSGAQSSYAINLDGVSGSLETISNGFVIKTGSTVTPRSFSTATAGISITNGNGQSGNPAISLTGLAFSIATQAGNGLIALNNSTSYTPVSIVGTTNQISVTNGNALGGNPTVGLANNPIVPGTAAITVPIGTTSQRPIGGVGEFRYNSDLDTYEGYAAGNWRQFSLSGGVVTFSGGSTGLLPSVPTNGAVVLSGLLNTTSGGTGAAGTLTGYVKGNGTSAMTAVATIPSGDISGLGSMATQNANAIAITGGSISGVSLTLDSLDSTPIGQTTPAAGAFTSLTGTSGSINGDTIATLTASQTLTNKSIDGNNNTLTFIGNSSLTNSSITINGSTVSLGGSITVTATASSPLTIGSGLSGTSYNGSTPVTITNTAPMVYPSSGIPSSTGSAWNTSYGTSGANSVVLRDSNQNISVNTTFEGFTSVAASSTQIVLTAASTPAYLVTGSGGQTLKLPDATTLPNGAIFTFNNNQTSGAILVNNNSNTLVVSIPSGGFTSLTLLSNANAAGSWDYHFSAPSNVSWSTNTFDYPGSITAATWNGATVQPNRGGTGQSAYATGDMIYASATNTLAKLSGNTTTTKNFLTQTGTGSASAAPAWGTISSGDVSGLGTMATQNASSVTITGGTIDNVTIGGTTPAAGTFTTVTATSGIFGGSF